MEDHEFIANSNLLSVGDDRALDDRRIIVSLLFTFLRVQLHSSSLFEDRTRNAIDTKSLPGLMMEYRLPEYVMKNGGQSVPSASLSDSVRGTIVRVLAL